jgi:hypothetical protein
VQYLGDLSVDPPVVIFAAASGRVSAVERIKHVSVHEDTSAGVEGIREHLRCSNRLTAFASLPLAR